MIRGVTVTVLRPTVNGTDRLGNPSHGEPEREAVGNVLVGAPSTQGMEAARRDGATRALTLHFPRSYSSSLRGCSVELPAPWAGTYRVVGDPRPYMGANTPTPWHMPVDVEASHG